MYPTDPTDPTRSADRRPAGELPAGPAHAAHPAGGDGTGPADPARAERADERPAETTGADRLSPWLTQPAPARTVELISGDFLITVNPVDGSEIEPCPPGSQPPAPVRLGADERAELRRAGRPPIPPGPGAPPLPLLERRDERDRLVALLGRGRSVRLTGSAGSGRTALLEAVAADCETLAPDGVVRLSGHHRTVTELLYELYAAVFRSPLHRPDRAGLRDLVRGIGAVVVVDDLEFGGDTLDELLEAAPECAFLLAVTPDVDAPISRSPLEEVLLGGLGRAASLDLLERATGRPLTDEEANWAGDLWFESEGLPQRFVQAGALLRGRDRLRAGPDAYEADGVLVHELAEPAYDRGPGDGPAGFAADGYDVPAPLPTLGEGAAPAGLLASRLGDAARETLRFAVALGGEVPHQAHLPALVGDTHADAAVGELMSSGLLSPVGARYRLAAGAVAQLEAEGYGEGATARAHTAVQHFTWWAGHPSVTPRRASTEADALLAALTPLLSSGEAGHASAAVLLARAAAPAFMAGLHWGAWERALRAGQEAARIAGEVAEEAYFHHELGILALCVGSLDRARAELETSISMRGAVADRRGTLSGRRALALVTDREQGNTPAVFLAADYEPPASPARGTSMVVPVLRQPSPDERLTLVTRRDGPRAIGGAPRGSAGRRRPVLGGARRNLVAAGAGAVLAAVLGTVVTLGATGNDTSPTDRVQTDRSTDDEGTGDYDAGTPTDASTKRPAEPGSVPVKAGRSTTPSPSTSGATESMDPSGTPSDDPSGPDDPDPSDPDPTDPTPTPTKTSPSPTPSGSSSPPPTSGSPSPSSTPPVVPPPPDTASMSAPATPSSPASASMSPSQSPSPSTDGTSIAPPVI
ncbi:ATP-binding protein [Streptomyces sp. NBC_01498]|uniref:ATP-binding protein n=1 Tax=Streptomyces sp. NBC_01498 TaxID=2975870 RepID=UPI002E7BAE91|nr:ATP-binding protein [Streptomyces sp. NBC_01498]WTL28735.1 ATP-binding protein [Streptomyces sp. NBC_01498]